MHTSHSLHSSRSTSMLSSRPSTMGLPNTPRASKPILSPIDTTVLSPGSSRYDSGYSSTSSSPQKLSADTFRTFHACTPDDVHVPDSYYSFRQPNRRRAQNSMMFVNATVPLSPERLSYRIRQSPLLPTKEDEFLDSLDPLAPSPTETEDKKKKGFRGLMRRCFRDGKERRHRRNLERFGEVEEVCPAGHWTDM